MKVLHLVHVISAQWYYRWAMREINPLHPDVRIIRMRQIALEDKARRLFA